MDIEAHGMARAGGPNYIRFSSGQPGGRGFTLIELLVVIGILVALLGISVFAFRRTAKRFQNKAAASRLETVLRQARNSAISASAPAFVELEVRKGTPRPKVIPYAYKLAGLWHFEDIKGNETSGAFNNGGLVNGCRLNDNGKIGKCMAFASWSKSQYVGGYIDCLERKDFDCESGGYLEAYIYPIQPITSQQFIFKKDDCYSMGVGEGGILFGSISGDKVVAENYRITPLHWTKVAFAWDRRSRRVLINDAVVGVGPGVVTRLKDTPLFIGDDSATFIGLIDEAKIMNVVAGRALILPPYAKIKHNAKPWDAIFFASDGSLDIRYHTGPITITIAQGRKRRAVTVSMLGMTQRHELEKLSEEEAEAAKEPKKKTTGKRTRRRLKPLAPAMPKSKNKEKEKVKDEDTDGDEDERVGPKDD